METPVRESAVADRQQAFPVSLFGDSGIWMRDAFQVWCSAIRLDQGIAIIETLLMQQAFIRQWIDFDGVVSRHLQRVLQGSITVFDDLGGVHAECSGIPGGIFN